MKRLRVLHVMGALNPSGMERMFVSAARHFSEHQVSSLIIGQGERHPFMNQLEDCGYEVEAIPSIRSFKGARALQTAIRRFSPDVIHVHTESAFLVSVLISRTASRVPIVRTVHNVFQPRGRAWLSRRVQAILADPLVSKFISPSPDVAANELAFGRHSTVVYNWVADNYVSNSAGVKSSEEVTTDAKLAVVVGNCSSIKNHEMALRSLVKNGYRVAHHGNETGASAEELSLLNSLESKGRLVSRGSSEPLESLRSAGVYVMPSTHEGMGVALAEAISVGIPCLVSDAPGLEWSKGLNGVQHIGVRQDDWDEALPFSGYVRQVGHVLPPDFSASRGAQQYVAIYKSMLPAEQADPVVSKGRMP